MKRKAVSFIFALLMFTVFLYGCGGGGGSSNPAASSISGNAVVSGVLKDSSNNPVANASVRLSLASNSIINSLYGNQNSSLRLSASGLPTEFTTTTDNNGRYTFSNVPYGDYTLKATKDDTGAIFSRFSVHASTIELTPAVARPFGTVKGNVKTSTGANIVGAIVSLAGSEFAVTNMNGEYTLNYVPILDEYTVEATVTGYSTDSTNVKIPNNDNLEFEAEDIVLTPSPKYYTVKTTIENLSISSSIVYVVAQDTLDEYNVSFGIYDNSSKLCLIKITKAGTYKLFAISSGNIGNEGKVVVEQTQINSNAVSEPITLQFATDTTGTVKGNIEFSEAYKGLLNSDRSNVPNESDYLVRLIGVNNNPYSYSTKATYMGDKVASYTFNNVMPGDYNILVDPAGNGFVGSIDTLGSIEVEAGETKVIEQDDTIGVDYVKPMFKVELEKKENQTPNLLIKEIYPFISRANDNIVDGCPQDTIGFCKINGGDDSSYSLPKLTLSGPETDGKSFILWKVDVDNDDWSFPLNANGTYTVIIQRNWSCNGFKGAITGTNSNKFEYKDATNYIGNVRVEKAFTNPITIANESGATSTNINSGIDYNNGFVSGWDGGSSSVDSFYYKNVNNTSFTKVTLNSISDGDQPKVLYAVSGNSCVFLCEDSDHNNIFKYYNGNSSSELTLTHYNETPSISEACIVNQNIVILYSYNDSSSLIGISTSLDLVTTAGITNISDFPCNPPNELTSSLKAAQDEQGNLFVAITQKSINEGETIKIYNLNKVNDNGIIPIICRFDAQDENPHRLKDFKILNNGTFYIETEGKASYIFASDGGNPIDSDLNQNRTSCFMDKYGFMYRYGTFTGDDNKTYSGIIKTASLDGEPIETYVYPTTPSNAGDSSTTHGILALEENPDGSALWTY